MNGSWRLLITGESHGRSNMAVDEAILAAVVEGRAPPTLRLYAWQPPCLSLGHAQPRDVVDEYALAGEGWDVVRRPTGGRALLHADELTYAVIAPASFPGLSHGVLPSYRYLSRGLLAGLERLGVHADPPVHAALSETDRLNPVCFEVPSAYEITVGGRKLIGSAQLRRGGAVLQHGSLPLSGDIARIIRVLRFPDEGARRDAAARLRRHATTLQELLGQTVAWSSAAQALKEAFHAELGWNLSEGSLTMMEVSAARELEETRYGPAESAVRSTPWPGDRRSP